ncbi:MAG: PAS domain S-box protein [Desulfomonile tiedjei]|uniref:histidine kinase n=1 Tax=Desulfomonile tiedjei TaxID=2358 RepID=A0A9D6V8G7_9BACT|nr:PAS domain S-box protein [Desulfomonile tiedjei]
MREPQSDSLRFASGFVAAEGEGDAQVLESLLDAMPEMVVYHDDNLNVIWANRAAAEFVGLKPEEMAGKRFFDVACRYEEPCEGCPVVRGPSSEHIEVIESNLLIGRLYFTRSYPISCREKKLPGRLIVAQDISSLRNRYSVTDVLNLISEVFHSPKSLSDICEELIKTIVRKFNYPYGVITIYDDKSDEVVVLGEIDLSGKFLPLVKRQPPFRCFSWKVMNDGKTINVTGLSKTDDFPGYVLKEAGVETILAVPLNVEGHAIGAIVLGDIIERLETNLMIDALQAVANRLGAEIQRKQIEETLREERKFTTAVLNNAGPLILVMDNEGRIVLFNKACEQLTGYSYKEAVGSLIWDFIVIPKEGAVIKSIFPFTADKKLPSSFENFWITRDGQRRLISWSNSIMGDAREINVHIVSIGIDITDKRRAEAEAELRRRQLLEADKMASLGVMASGVAHEINNPNNFIMMNAPILRQVWEDVLPILDKYYEECGDFTVSNIPYSEMREEIPKLFDGMQEGSKRIRQIIMSMKNYAKRDPSGVTQCININDVIVAALELMSHQIKESTRSIVVDCAQDLPFVGGTPQRLEQVVVNLIQNACQALPDRNKGISIKTSYDKRKDQVVVCVTDEGIGIKPEHLDHVFDPFFTTKIDVGGTGLGLSVCAGIVKEHHGRLEFESELGNGTKAFLSLPVMH